MRRTIIGVLLAACLLVGAGRAQAQAAATMEVDGWLLGAGIGWSAVEGTITFEGQTYPVTVMATSALTVGASYLCGSAQVYGLHRLEDLNGTYDGAAFGASFLAGGHGGRFVGRNGVEIETQFHSVGVDLQGAIQRIRVVVHESEGRPAPTHFWPGRSSIVPVH
ncbi:MAG TPA: hypothetical protein VNO26_03415 [Candidatus Limnocylindria bacterium]|nr:hypothetical protein [Candidatus Limnocylindria bacterium]